MRATGATLAVSSSTRSTSRFVLKHYTQTLETGTASPPNSRTTQFVLKHRTRTLLLVTLFAAWMLPGLIGRDPWKADEAYSFGLVLNMVQTGDWVVPTLGADPFMEKPPIFYITSAIFAPLLSPPLELHEAARAACVFFLLLTLLSLAMASREWNGPGTGWLAPILLLGCVGLVHTAHMLMTDNSLLAGYAMAFWGIALGPRKPWAGGLVCGTGSGLAFLSKGLLGPGLVGLTVLCLPLFFQTWRTKDYFRFLGGIFLAALPWVSIWPCVLYQRSPALFNDWFWNNNFGRYFGTSYLVSKTQPAFFFVQRLPYFAWPVFPLAFWVAWKQRRSLFREPAAGVPLLAFLIALTVLSLSRQGREVYALPLLAPLTLLATRVVEYVSPRFLKAANICIFTLFSLLSIVAWLGWLAQLTGQPAFVLERIRAKVPGYVPVFEPWGFAIALLVSVCWIVLIFRHRPEKPLLFAHWTAGVALLYLLGMTLWLPVTNANMTYRHDFVGLRPALGDTPGIIASINLGEPQRAVLHYYTGVTTWQQETRRPTNYNWLLIQGETGEGKQPQPPDRAWEQVWEGHHHRELFRLYRRQRGDGTKPAT